MSGAIWLTHFVYLLPGRFLLLLLSCDGAKKEEENGLELRACQFFCVAFFQGRLWYRVTDPT